MSEPDLRSDGFGGTEQRDRDPRRRSDGSRPATREFNAYDPEHQRPLTAYSVLTVAFAALSATVLGLLAARGRTPARFGVLRTVRVGVATHKLARLIAKDKVTSPYRAPFVRFASAEQAAPAEVSEDPRGSGLRYAIGELIGCPYCLAPWIATALHLGLAAAPERTRLLIAVLESVTVADFLQIAYKGSESKLL